MSKASLIITKTLGGKSKGKSDLGAKIEPLWDISKLEIEQVLSSTLYFKVTAIMKDKAEVIN